MGKKSKKTTDVLRRELKKGRKRGIGLFEWLYLVIIGFKDGKNGVPKEEDGIWKSSILNKERNSYEEYGDRIWGDLQISLNDIHINCDNLMKEIPLLGAQLDVARKEEVVASQKAVIAVRRRGEEEISEDQVLARRSREKAREVDKLHAKVLELEHKLLKDYEDLTNNHHYIAESMNAARMVCERVMKHSDQRIDVYWRSAHMSHKNKDSMPMTAPGLNPPQAEITYSAQHKGFNNAIEQVINKYEKDVAEIKIHLLESNEEVA